MDAEMLLDAALETKGTDSERPRKKESSRDRDRDRDRDKEKDRHRKSREVLKDGDRDRSRKKESSRDRDKDKDRDRRRKKDSSRDRDKDKDRHRRRKSRSRSPHRRPKPKVDLESVAAPLEDEMMRRMGFAGFDTTKNKKVEGNAKGEARVNKPRKYRQYMNRKGGFNRPLDFIA